MAATLEQVMQALAAADAAGNKEDAQQLALMAQQMMQEQPAQESPSVGSEILRQVGLTARGAITGLTEMGPMQGAEAVSGLVNYAAGKPILKPREALQQTLTAVGLPEPRPGLEQAVQSGVSALGGTAGQIGLAQKAGSALLKPLTEDVIGQFGAAAGSSVGSELASQAAEKEGWGQGANTALSLLGGVFGGSVGAKTGRVASSKLGVTPPPLTIGEVEKTARNAYDRIDQSGVTLNANKMVQKITDIEKNLKNFIPEMDTHRPVKQTLDNIKKVAAQGDLTFTKADELRKSLSSLAFETKDETTKRFARQSLKELDDYLANLSPADLVGGQNKLASVKNDIVTARSSWRKKSNADTIQDLLEAAKFKADSTGKPLGEVLKQDFKNFALKDYNMASFSPDEQAAIRRVATGTKIDDLLKTISLFDPRRSRFAASVTGAGFVAAPTTTTLAVGSALLSEKTLSAIKNKAVKQLQQDILRGKVERPTNMAMWRTLLETRINEATKEEEQKQQEMKVAP